MKNLEEIRRTKVFAAMQNENLTFGGLIRIIRKIIGMNLAVVCEDIGVSYFQMRALESDCYVLEPKEDVIKKITNYYGIPYDYASFKIQSRLKSLHDVRREKIND